MVKHSVSNWGMHSQNAKVVLMVRVYLHVILHLFLRATMFFYTREARMYSHVYSSARGGARKRINAARDPRPTTGKKYPPKSPTLEATIWDEATWVAKSAIVFSIRFNLGASRATEAGEAFIWF